MPFCPRHNNFYKGFECRECVHDKARDKEDKAKIEAKREKQLLKAKLKQSQPNPAVKKISKKHKEALSEYNTERLKWLPGKMCVVFPKQIATTIHHAKGRIGYADNEARLKGITLLMDKRYWIPASLEGHRWIEELPQEAKDRGWSQSRLENLDQEERTI